VHDWGFRAWVLTIALLETSTCTVRLTINAIIIVEVKRLVIINHNLFILFEIVKFNPVISFHYIFSSQKSSNELCAAAHFWATNKIHHASMNIIKPIVRDEKARPEATPSQNAQRFSRRLSF